MKKLLLFRKHKKHDRLSQKIQQELQKQLLLVGTLSETCVEITQGQMQECLPLLLAFHPKKVRGWQDKEHHAATLSLSFKGNHQLLINVFCPPQDTQPWYPDTKIFLYHGSLLGTYLACHHSHLCAALHKSMQKLSQQQHSQKKGQKA
ncbi:hypothetical protein [Hymenobacter cellulosivorans]|uniref:DUF302 domain-containing protein n=1 Tax=Hymenobacter cellulosivorans TaxID=2932249 RepID=A0ABY4F5L5_9BACT|nr:hypothetical protein [Hymenobacter cellulosivorans]UOQ51769.1 hypothetical protein MUN80_18645 [Hymenobacter cellulosivorans]